MAARVSEELSLNRSLPTIFERFQEAARLLSIPLDSHQINQFRIYLDELRQWNRAVRLIATDDPETIIWVHFLDSLSAYPFLLKTDSLLDIGTGAGFPGVPLKIALPQIRLHLVESRRRKTNFLKHLIRKLDLKHTTVYHQRLAKGDRLGSFHSIISRAVAPPRVWLPWALALLGENGQILLMLGRKPDMTSLLQLQQELGLKVYEQMDFELPVVKHRRCIVVLRKGECFT